MKKLHMVGHSHIDPVWFWDWKEGMQEVKATFQSVLDRMEEFPMFRFSSTSVAFYQWLQRVAPESYKKVQQLIAEGRWELCGGWLIEPDCILPHGEAFVRQGLYGQRWLQQNMGLMSSIAANPDSFGHEGNLPQILKKSGMKEYVFMRPRVSPPAFMWRGPDGTEVMALSLPGEYTTWFHEPTKKNIEDTLARSQDFEEMVCCYGVGNHGGGPTIANIESILALQKEYKETELQFSTFGTFFEGPSRASLVTKTGSFEKVNAGCYSVDHPFKQLNRQTEQRLLEADSFLAMAHAFTGKWAKESNDMQALWTALLFNQFHDTLGGTITFDVRNQAMAQVAGSLAGADVIVALAMQDIANTVDTRGEGWPLFLYNTAGCEYAGMVEVELEWFCQDALRIEDNYGNEVDYQRICTDAKVTHTVLGGRRRILFYAKVPAGGFAVYRLYKAETTGVSDSRRCPEGLPTHMLENEYISLSFDKNTGMPCSLLCKTERYEALQGVAELQLWKDERDAWGGNQGRAFGDTQERFALVQLDKVEDGALRQTVRATYELRNSKMQILYRLGAHDNFVTLECRLYWQEPWHLLKWVIPTAERYKVVCDAAYGVVERVLQDNDEYYMHSWADITGTTGNGLLVANESLYAFSMEEGGFAATLVRSPIYAQGNSKEWYNTTDDYHYTDIGEHHFKLLLCPHSTKMENYKANSLARLINCPIRTLFDNSHKGERNVTVGSGFASSNPSVEIAVVKKAEDGESVVLRLRETEGESAQTTIIVQGKAVQVALSPWEIKTLIWAAEEKTPQECNLLEWHE